MAGHGELDAWPGFTLCQHEAPGLPLCAPLPCRAVRLAYQQIQRLLTSLVEADLLRAEAISGYLSQARPETPERLRAWHLPTRGDSPQLC